MIKIEEAQDILRSLGLPVAQHNEIAALTLLALCDVGPEDTWQNARRHGVSVTKGIMRFVERKYDRRYAPNTRETFRRQVLHQFIQACLIERNPFAPNLPTNSPHTHYALTEAALSTIRTYGTVDWDAAVRRFIAQQGSLLTVYQRRRRKTLVPVRLPDGTVFQLSPGKHNQLQAAVIEEFGPRFVAGAQLLYLGDTQKKTLYLASDRIRALGVTVTQHDKLPDVLLYDVGRNWIFLVEAVTSHGPMTAKRVLELEEMFAECTVGLIFVSAFLQLAEFRRHLSDIAWETEVWVAEMPDHLIHFNGDRFLGPRT